MTQFCLHLFLVICLSLHSCQLMTFLCFQALVAELGLAMLWKWVTMARVLPRCLALILDGRVFPNVLPIGRGAMMPMTGLAPIHS